MNGIASLLADPHKSQIEALWQELDRTCGLIGMRLTPTPHFTYQVVEDYDHTRLEPALQDIARSAKPFMVRTTGLGLFTGESPIIYIPIIKDEALIRFHDAIWEHTRHLALAPNLLYTSSNWIPHITLAHGDVNRAKLACAMEVLAQDTYNWEIWVNNIAYVNQSDRQVGGNCCIYEFGEGHV